MAIHYYCRHCGTKIGRIDGGIHAEKMGINLLSNEERQEMISYLPNGDIHIKAICDDCHEALERFPHFHECDYLIQ
ncbi:anti-sigma-F factor Fin family protein [Heyndrickxia ginsengihumi]|uniref:Anti-sigma-F factor Fin family protein n=1 Tax=Heyndrickxia ginsengihumi TaxID=363870 RepID=A0A0A6XY20_9BACI|nr:anti-sigma-F factor Fin family protein [Heyndrickxia ginsengihumi]KHD85027.1 hypothetical protein NG54_11750 [Heyndrickxia ginsengihumi]MBE6183221.1 anti-sigma-F factor Fin family protein [Bacillus sp. (in: firmicutes)]MCM3024349.1 anti-sigma-F factor Fin family protein [Heyndrickxia ginsengihumi]NEY21151.1 anti-sigma-F factor Fin family protein [Heyndrickxia ginsengihumi]